MRKGEGKAGLCHSCNIIALAVSTCVIRNNIVLLSQVLRTDGLSYHIWTNMCFVMAYVLHEEGIKMG